jgi:hypothetical protein
MRAARNSPLPLSPEMRVGGDGVDGVVGAVVDDGEAFERVLPRRGRREVSGRRRRRSLGRWWRRSLGRWLRGALVAAELGAVVARGAGGGGAWGGGRAGRWWRRCLGRWSRGALVAAVLDRSEEETKKERKKERRRREMGTTVGPAGQWRTEAGCAIEVRCSVAHQGRVRHRGETICSAPRLGAPQVLATS